MFTHSVTVPALDPHGHTARVEICGRDAGGWDVTASLDGRVVAIRHCCEWHRAERTRAVMTGELLALARAVEPVASVGDLARPMLSV